MVKQPPQLLTRVLRAISALREENGSTVTNIVAQVRFALGDTASLTSPRNVTMQVRRALKHGVENGLVSHRAGRYRVTGKKRLVPVDSLELAIDASKRRRRKKKVMQQRAKGKSRKGSQHDYYRGRTRTSYQRRQKATRKKSNRKKSLTPKSSKSSHSHPQCTPSHHSNITNRSAASEHRGKPSSRPASSRPASSRPATSSRPASARSTHSNAAPDDKSNVPMAQDGPEHERDTTPRRRGRPRRKRNPGPVPVNPPDAVPTVQDEPMDAMQQLRPNTGRRSLFRSLSDVNEGSDVNADSSTYFN